MPSNSPQQRRLPSAVMISLITKFCIQSRHLTRYQIPYTVTIHTSQLNYFYFKLLSFISITNLPERVLYHKKIFHFNGIEVMKVINN